MWVDVKGHILVEGDKVYCPHCRGIMVSAGQYGQVPVFGRIFCVKCNEAFYLEGR